MTTDFTALINLIESSLPLHDLGFTESAKFQSHADSVVIYNSDYCRIKFRIERERSGENLRVYYGRLHAVDDAQIIKWHGEDHYCWYGEYELQLALRFFDGQSPKDAFAAIAIFHPLYQNYFDSDLAKNAKNLLEQSINLQAVILENYGERLFELLDIRRPNMWEKYINFLKEFYKLIDDDNKNKGVEKSLPYGPPPYKFC